MSQPLVQRHVIAALVTNEPGVLSQVAGMFAARGYNIDSLVVGRTENPNLSRMTIVVNGDEQTLDQIRKQLKRLVPVVKVVDYTQVAYVERDLMLVTVSSANDQSIAGNREELITLANLFRANVVDVAPDRVMVEISGAEDKLEAFVQLLEPYGILELARTGVIAMPRGSENARPNAVKAAVGLQKDSGIDMGDLPPG